MTTLRVVRGKSVQAHFYRFDYSKAKRLTMKRTRSFKADAKYQELSKKLAAYQASLASGELGKKLKALESEEGRATVKFQEADQKVKDVKSELEEAWYEHDHAVQQKRDPKPYLDLIGELEKSKAQLDKELEPARDQTQPAKRRNQKDPVGVKEIEDELTKMSVERDKWVRVMENDTFKLGPLRPYKIPKIQQVSLDEFDRNRFDQPVARVDRCQTCHMAINRPGFEKGSPSF